MSHALNLGTQRIPSASLRLPPPARSVCILYLYTCRFTGSVGSFAERCCAGTHANQNPTGPALRIVRFSQKLCSLSKKRFSLSANGQCRTKLQTKHIQKIRHSQLARETPICGDAAANDQDEPRTRANARGKAASTGYALQLTSYPAKAPLLKMFKRRFSEKGSRIAAI